MGPRHNAAENLQEIGLDLMTLSGFNGAAAQRRGKLLVGAASELFRRRFNGAAAQRRGKPDKPPEFNLYPVASMGPRHNAAENFSRTLCHILSYLASMGPRHNAAENGAWRVSPHRAA